MRLPLPFAFSQTSHQLYLRASLAPFCLSPCGSPARVSTCQAYRCMIPGWKSVCKVAFKAWTQCLRQARDIWRKHLHSTAGASSGGSGGRKRKGGRRSARSQPKEAAKGNDGGNANAASTRRKGEPPVGEGGTTVGAAPTADADADAAAEDAEGDTDDVSPADGAGNGAEEAGGSKSESDAVDAVR